MPYNVVRLREEIRVNTSTSGMQGGSEWFQRPDGTIVFQWRGNGTQAGREDIGGLFQQVFDANGQRIGSEIRINETVTGEVQRSLAVGFAGGRWGAVWEVAADETTSQRDFYMRSLTANGAAGPETRINETEGGGSKSWNHMFLRNGNSLHIWEGRSTKAGQEDDHGIFFRLVDVNGNFVTGETRVNMAVAGRDEIGFSSAPLADGGWVVTYRSATDTSLVWQQAFYADGSRRGSEVQLPATESNVAGLPSIRNLADGKWMTSWYEGSSPTNRDLHYQIFNSDGTPGEKALITTSTEGDQVRVASLSLANGGFMALWRGGGTQTGQEDDRGLFYQRFDANGVKIGGETRINATADGVEQGIQNTVIPYFAYRLTPDGRYVTDKYVVTWKGIGDQSGQEDADGGLFFQLIDAATGLKVGSETRVTTTTEGSAPSEYDYASLAHSDRFVFVWGGNGTQPGQQDDSGVFMQVFDRNGARIGSETRVNTTVDGKQGQPLVRELSNGSWVVVWQGPDAEGSDGLYMQAFDRNGSRVGDEIRINSSTAGDQWLSSIDFLADGTVLIGWEGVGDQPDQEDAESGLFFQRFKINSAPESVALSGSIQETAAAGTTAGTLSALDRDPSDKHTFTLVDAANSPTSNALFEITGDAIKLKSGAKLNYEAAASHNMRVKVSDAFGGSYVQDVAVSVTNVREKTPLRKTGTSVNDIQRGELGNDTLSGAGGDDRLYGDLGRDRISTGSGKDAVIFDQRPSSSNRDTISDFDPRKDSLYFDNAFFSKLGKRGSPEKPAKLASTFFEAGLPDDANDYLIYNRKTGILSYDADGNKAGKAIEIAVFTNKPKLTAADFFVI
jgi:Ca2+-binding RTX toxin-like protein